MSSGRTGASLIRRFLFGVRYSPLFLLLGAVLAGCQAPDLLFSDRKPVTVRSEDYTRLWQACRAVIARQYDVVQENEANGRIVATSKIAPTVARPNSDPSDSRTVSTLVNVFILTKDSGYEVQVRAGTRSQPGPNYDATRPMGLGMPGSRESLDFNSLGTTANRDYRLEEQLQSQIQAELGYAPAPPSPKK